MSLESAVLKIADEMEQLDEEGGLDILSQWVSRLRLVVEACKQEEVSRDLQGDLGMTRGHGVERMSREQEGEIVARRRKQIDERARQSVADTVRREEEGGTLARFVGGKMDGTFVPVDSKMPVGAKTMLEGDVYEYRGDRKFHLVDAKDASS